MSRIADAYVRLIPVKDESQGAIDTETWEAIVYKFKTAAEINIMKNKSRIADAYVTVTVPNNDGTTKEVVAKVVKHIDIEGKN
jgi:hypothetical protein